jgi:hypothetical protein
VVAGYGTLREGGYVFEGNPPPPRTSWFRLYVEDNGLPIYHPTPPVILQSSDVVSYEFSDTATNCTFPSSPPTPTMPQNQRVGDLVVRDAPALPTSKDQCKNGGWRDFGDTFKNQGQCVAFVERGPKP